MRNLEGRLRFFGGSSKVTKDKATFSVTRYFKIPKKFPKVMSSTFLM